MGEVPLAEQSERYAVTIFDGADVVRALETTSPDYRYSAADLAADFGPSGSGAAITFSVAQISDAVGRGVESSVSATIE